MSGEKSQGPVELSSLPVILSDNVSKIISKPGTGSNKKCYFSLAAAELLCFTFVYTSNAHFGFCIFFVIVLWGLIQCTGAVFDDFILTSSPMSTILPFLNYLVVKYRGQTQMFYCCGQESTFSFLLNILCSNSKKKRERKRQETINSRWRTPSSNGL